MALDSIFLWPIGWLYGKIADVRNAFYDRGTFASHNLGAWTISVGNITAGGTGKTPIVAHIAAVLAEAGEAVCVLTRGYGRKSSGRILVSDRIKVLADAATGGDEPVELAQKLIGKAVVIADADRVSAARWAKEKFGITAFVLDDGFQHRKARRDLDVVCIDATDPCGGGHMLPAGRLREPFRNIDRADVIILTRANLIDSIEPTLARIKKRNSHAPVFAAIFQIARVSKIERQGEPTTEVEDPSVLGRVFAFCGLGNPATFYSQLRLQEIDVVGTMDFSDHYFYCPDDLAAIEAQAKASSATSLITTAKDAVKLNGMKLSIPCYVAELEVSVSEPEYLQKLITSS